MAKKKKNAPAQIATGRISSIVCVVVTASLCQVGFCAVLFHKDILTNKEIYEKTLSISSSQIKDYYKNVFVKDILAKHIFFYYSNKNINKQILALYTKQMPGVVCKTHYIP